MITLISAWLTERIVTVLTVTLVAVAVVPTSMLLLTEHQVATVQLKQEDDQRLILVQTVKQAGDAIVAKLTTAESSCNTQVAQLVATSKLNAPRITTAVNNGKNQIHASATPFILAIQKEEDEFAHLAVISPDIRDTYVTQIQLLGTTALGNGQTVGVVTVTCQMIVLEIQQIIVIVIRHQEFEDD